MKSEIKSAETKKYPYLGVYEYRDGTITIVLFTSLGLGTCVYSTIERNQVGFHASDWHEPKFTPFNGEITLKN